MKKLAAWILMVALLLCGCGSQAEQTEETELAFACFECAQKFAADQINTDFGLCQDCLMKVGAAYCSSCGDPCFTRDMIQGLCPECSEAVQTTQTTQATQATQATEATAETTPETTAPTAPPETTGETESLFGVPYLQEIHRSDESIYDGPGYDYFFVGTVRERGIYTIVEEAWDDEGNLWGKLKSGLGWVDLSKIRSGDYPSSLISANYADESLLRQGDYHYCPGEDVEYSIAVAFRAYGTLRDVSLFLYDFSGDEIVPGEDFYYLSELTQDKPLVAELTFYGDMTTYGIRFVDETGAVHTYSIYISGRNGDLVLQKD